MEVTDNTHRVGIVGGCVWLQNRPAVVTSEIATGTYIGQASAES